MIRQKHGDVVFGEGDQGLAQVVGEMLLSSKKTIALAESCTGGLVSKLLTDVPGSSAYFTYGWVTYSNQAKIDTLGVSGDLMEKNGAVSAEIAQAIPCDVSTVQRDVDELGLKKTKE